MKITKFFSQIMNVILLIFRKLWLLCWKKPATNWENWRSILSLPVPADWRLLIIWKFPLYRKWSPYLRRFRNWLPRQMLPLSLEEKTLRSFILKAATSNSGWTESVPEVPVLSSIRWRLFFRRTLPDWMSTPKIIRRFIPLQPAAVFLPNQISSRWSMTEPPKKTSPPLFSRLWSIRPSADWHVVSLFEGISHFWAVRSIFFLSWNRLLSAP